MTNMKPTDTLDSVTLHVMLTSDRTHEDHITGAELTRFKKCGFAFTELC